LASELKSSKEYLLELTILFAAFGPMEGDISPESVKKLISEQSN